MGVGAVVQARGAEAVTRTEMGTHLGQDLGPPQQVLSQPSALSFISSVPSCPLMSR